MSNRVERIAAFVPGTAGLQSGFTEASDFVDRLVEPRSDAVPETLSFLGEVQITDGETDRGAERHGRYRTDAAEGSVIPYDVGCETR